MNFQWILFVLKENQDKISFIMKFNHFKMFVELPQSSSDFTKFLLDFYLLIQFSLICTYNVIQLHIK